MITAIKDAIQGKTPSLGVKRSGQWVTVRKHFIAKNNVCAVCGGKKKLEVHHVKPFHLYPEFELDPTNLITLCEDLGNGINCHLLIGHLGNYRNVNTAVREDAAVWREKLSTPIPLVRE